eukprot:29362_1
MLGTKNGMKWHNSSILFGSVIKTKLSLYNLLQNGKLLIMASKRTLDKRKQKFVFKNGMSESLCIAMMENCAKYHGGTIPERVDLIMHIDEANMATCIGHNPKTSEITGQTSQISEELFMKSISDLLLGKEMLKAAGMVLQIVFVSARSGWKYQGPIYKSEGGYNSIELFNIIFGDIFLNIHMYAPVFHIKMAIPDCAQANMTVCQAAMGLPKKKLRKMKVLKFKDPFTGEDCFFQLCSDHVGRALKNGTSKSHKGSRRYKKKGDFPLKRNGKPIDWGYMKLAADICKQNVQNGEFTLFKRLTKRSVDLPLSFDKMSNTMWIAVMCEDTRSCLRWCVENDDRFGIGAQPLLENLEAQAGLFFGKMICPKSGPENAQIKSMKHPIFEEQLKHLKYFESGGKTDWYDPGLISRLKQTIYTAHAFAEDFFETNKRMGIEKYLTMFKFTNKPVESSHGEIRGLGKMQSCLIDGGKGIQRIFSEYHVETGAKKLEKNKKHKRFYNQASYQSYKRTNA